MKQWPVKALFGKLLKVNHIFIMKRRIILCAAVLMAAVANTFACTNLIVGKNASADGSTIVSYSADSYGLFGELYHYPVYGKKVAHAIVDGECDKGILICGTGIGISIAANKVPGIRAAVCSDCFSAEATRLHNDANILAFGARVVGPGLAEKIVDIFLDTEFSGVERHKRRVDMIEE